MKNKLETIELMRKLLEFAEDLPMFSVSFDIKATNNDIEEYILEHVDKTDWNGFKLSENEIKNSIECRLKDFHNSAGYNANGLSLFRMNKCITLQSINFSDIHRLVSGEENNMPKNYSFAGNLELTDYNNF